MHSLELLPGIGKKYMWNILRAREQKPFTSFQDMMDRTEITDPAKLIIKRVIEELSEEPKYRLFTRSM
jgi:putative nucleotide binding protein